MKVIHWDYNKPDSQEEVATQELRLTPLQAIPREETDKKGIGYRFTYRLKTKGKSVLSYIAECHYLIDKDEPIGRAEIIKMVRDLYTPYEAEFDERKKALPLRYNSLPIWDETKFDHTTVLRLLQE